MATPQVITPAFSSQEPKSSTHTDVPKCRPAQRTRTIRYCAEQVNLMVKFSLISPNPLIRRETGESLRTLRAISCGKRLPTASVLRYFELRREKASYLWDID